MRGDFYAIKYQPTKMGPLVIQRLNTVTCESASEAIVSKQDTGIIFDFDNTTIMHDIEDHLMMYIFTHLAYKMTPDEFFDVLTTGPMTTNLFSRILKIQLILIWRTSSPNTTSYIPTISP